MVNRIASIIVGIVACTSPLAAQGREADAAFANFKFADGSTLPELRIHYRTIGTPKKDAKGVVTNAILILHGTGGTNRQFIGSGFAGKLYGAGQPFDTAANFLIIPDNIGHGKSSKPSDGLHAKFPHYRYADMVRAQYRLVTETLGVNHLRVILGTSMGCMHAWVWGTTYPDMVDGLVPLACIPAQIAGRNRMMRRIAMDAITNDPAWNHGEYVAQPTQGLRNALGILFVMGSAPLVQQAQAPTRDAADSVIRKFLDDRAKDTDANDFLYQFDSSSDYDPSALLGRVQAKVLYINSADDFINPPELKLAEKYAGQVKMCQFIVLPITAETRGHGTHTVPAIWGGYLQEFLRTLS